MTQWHPIFDYLLRAALKDYYEVQTNVPVGDLPREADIVLVRRSSIGKPPFRTLWKNLTRWNVLEFKGRSESARMKHLDLLIEVGIGIHRRLQEQDPNIKMPRRDVSLWYLANHLGKRFLRDVVELIGNVESTGPGVWHGFIVGRPIWLVSNRDLPVDAETASVRMVSDQTVEQMRELATVILANEEIWNTFGAWLVSLYPDFNQEFQAMATTRKKGEIDLGANIRRLLHELGPTRLIELGFAKQLLDDIGPDQFLAELSPKQREELLQRLQRGSHGAKQPTK